MGMGALNLIEKYSFVHFEILVSQKFVKSVQYLDKFVKDCE